MNHSLHYCKNYSLIVPSSKISSNMEFRFSKTQRGAPLLIDNEGYWYTLHDPDSSRWRCRDRRTHGCSATCVINEKAGTICRRAAHTHVGNWGKIKAHEAISEIQRTATVMPTELPSELLQEAKGKVDEETAGFMPSTKSLTRLVRRYQTSKLELHPPKTIDDVIELPERFRILKGNEKWLIGDTSNHRQLVFASPDGLNTLRNSTYWISDGTFRTVPNLALQLYSIHAQLPNGQFTPSVYSLMTRKTKVAYSDLLRILKDELRDKDGNVVGPKTFSTDFKEAAVEAFKEAFPDATHGGCLFHFGQIMWRALQRAGLQGKYSIEGNTKLRKDFHRLIGLAFVPPSDIPTVFDKLIDDIDENLLDVCEHLQRNYVEGKKIGKRFKPPTFPPTSWSVYQRVLEGLPRTTNAVEGWHFKLNMLMRRHHVNLYAFLERLLKMEGEARWDRWRCEIGKSPPKQPKKYRTLDESIRRVVGRYDSYKARDDTRTYLAAVGLLFSGNIPSTPDDEARSDCDDEQPQQESPKSGKRRMQTSPSPSCTKQTKIEYSFSPPSVQWQRKSCQKLGLRFQKKAALKGRSNQMVFTNLGPGPEKIKSVMGDGACLFRALSFWITGVETSHEEVRKAVCDEMGLPSFSTMRQSETWGTSDEIQAACNLLETKILVWSLFGKRIVWHAFDPMPQTDQAETATVYLNHASGNHYEPVISIKKQ